MGNLDSKTIISGIVLFFTVELILRQCMSRLDTISKMRLDSLSTNIRPALRKVQAMLKKNIFSEVATLEIVELIEGMKPLPPRFLTITLEKINYLGSFVENRVLLEELKADLEELLRKERKYCCLYVNVLGTAETPYGVSLLLTMLFFSLPLLWIPLIILFYFNLVPIVVAGVAVLIAVLYEIYARKNEKALFW